MTFHLLIYSIIFFVTPLASQASDSFLEYKYYDLEIIKEAHKILKLSPDEIDAYVKAAMKINNQADFENISALIYEHSILYSELFKEAKESQKQKYEQFAQRLSIRTLMCMQSFIKSVSGSAEEPFLDIKQLIRATKQLLDLLNDLTVHKIFMLNEYQAYESIDKKNKNILVQMISYIYNHSTAENLGKRLGNLVGFFLGIFISIKLYKLLFKLMFNLVSFLINRKKA